MSNSVQVQVQFFLFGIVYEKQNVQTLKQARLTNSKTKGNNKIIYHVYIMYKHVDRFHNH